MLLKKIIINLGAKMEDLLSNNKLQETASKLAIFRSDIQKLISEQELCRNKSKEVLRDDNVDDDTDKDIIETKEDNTKTNIDKDNKPNIDDNFDGDSDDNFDENSDDDNFDDDKGNKPNIDDDSDKTPFETTDK